MANCTKSKGIFLYRLKLKVNWIQLQKKQKIYIYILYDHKLIQVFCTLFFFVSFIFYSLYRIYATRPKQPANQMTNFFLLTIEFPVGNLSFFQYLVAPFLFIFSFYCVFFCLFYLQICTVFELFGTLIYKFLANCCKENIF